MLTDAYRGGGWVGLVKSVAYVICEWPLGGRGQKFQITAGR